MILLLQMNVGLLIGLSTFQAVRPFIQEYSDSILIYLFNVSCMSHVIVSYTMLRKQVSVFSFFYYYFCLPESLKVIYAHFT